MQKAAGRLFRIINPPFKKKGMTLMNNNENNPLGQIPPYNPVNGGVNPMETEFGQSSNTFGTDPYAQPLPGGDSTAQPYSAPAADSYPSQNMNAPFEGAPPYAGAAPMPPYQQQPNPYGMPEANPYSAPAPYGQPNMNPYNVPPPPPPYGVPVAPYGIPMQRPMIYSGPFPGNTFCTISLILGIFSVITGVVSFFMIAMNPHFLAALVTIAAIIMAIVAIVLGAMGGNQNVRSGRPRGGLGTGALVVSIIALVLATLTFGCTGCIAAAYCSGAIDDDYGYYSSYGGEAARDARCDFIIGG